MYTIEQFRTEKIAIHCETQEEWDKCMIFFEEKGIAERKNTWDVEKEKTCVRILQHKNQYGCTETIEYCNKDWYEQQGYTIIKPHQLIIEEYESEEQIQGGFTKEMIEEAKKNPEKYGLKYELTEDASAGDIKGFDDEAEKLSYHKKGSRMWAFEMLDRGEKVRHEVLGENVKYIHLSSSKRIISNWVNYYIESFPEDGWELYEPEEEKPETMTLREACNKGKTIKFKNGKSVSFSHFKDCFEDFAKYFNNLDTQVEIIEEE